MPREQITKSGTVRHSETPDSTILLQRNHLHVGWSNDREAQVGVEIEVGQLQRILEDALAAPFHGIAGDPQSTAVIFVDLDRGEANSLIRATRRARDRAYGRDE